MTKQLTKISWALFVASMLSAGSVSADPGHLGKIDTLGLKTGMTHEEVKQVLAKLKKTWKEAPLRMAGANFEKDIGEIHVAKFVALETNSSEELDLTYTKENILYKIKRVTNWTGDQRPAFNTAIAAAKEKFGTPTSERPWGESIQLYYHSMDGGKTITAEELQDKRGNISNATKCLEFTQRPPSMSNNPAAMLTQDVAFAKCGGSLLVMIEADNPNYPQKGPREIARRMDISIEDPRIYLASAQMEYQLRQKQLQEQADKAKKNGLKPIM